MLKKHKSKKLAIFKLNFLFFACHAMSKVLQRFLNRNNDKSQQ